MRTLQQTINEECNSSLLNEAFNPAPECISFTKEFEQASHYAETLQKIGDWYAKFTKNIGNSAFVKYANKAECINNPKKKTITMLINMGKDWEESQWLVIAVQKTKAGFNPSTADIVNDTFILLWKY